MIETVSDEASDRALAVRLDAREKRAVASAKGARAARARAPRVAGALVTARSDALARAPAAPARTAADIPGLCGRRNVGRILPKARHVADG